MLERWDSGHVANGFINSDRTQAVLARDQSSSEIATECYRNHFLMQIAADRVEATRCADDAIHLRFEMTDPHLVAYIRGLAHVDRSFHTRDTDVAPRGEANARIAETGDHRLQGVWMNAYGCIRIDNDVATQQPSGSVFRRRLATARRHAQQFDAAMLMRSNSFISAVIGRVRDEQDLNAVPRVFQL